MGGPLRSAGRRRVGRLEASTGRIGRIGPWSRDAGSMSDMPPRRDGRGTGMVARTSAPVQGAFSQAHAARYGMIQWGKPPARDSRGAGNVGVVTKQPRVCAFPGGIEHPRQRRRSDGSPHRRRGDRPRSRGQRPAATDGPGPPVSRRSLHRPRGHRHRRHGHGAHGLRPQARSQGRPQDPPRQGSAQHHRSRPDASRGTGARAAQPPEHRHGPRRGRVRRTAVHRDGVRRRGRPRRLARRSRPRLARDHRELRRGRPRTGRGASSRHHAP